MAEVIENIEDAIREAVRRRMNEVATEELEELKGRIATRVSKELDIIAVSVMKHYDITMNRNTVTIAVRKPTGHEDDRQVD